MVSFEEVRKLQIRVKELSESKDVVDRITAILIDPGTTLRCLDEGVAKKKAEELVERIGFE